MTRRAKLRKVLQNYVAAGRSTQDLLNSVESFTAAGGSGIENFLDGELAAAQPVVTADVSAAKFHLEQAIAALG